MARTSPLNPYGGIFLPVIFFGAFAFFYLFLQPVFADPDTPWHLATGDLIRELGHVPTKDPWSYTAPGAFWLNYSWGWGVFISCLNSLFGLDGLFVISALWMAGIVTLLAATLLKRGGTSQDPVLIAATLAAMALVASAGFRPQSFSFLAALLLYTLLHFSRTKKRERRILWQFPLFMAVWVNMHSGFVFGFILLGAYGLEALIAKNLPRFRLLVGAGILGLLAIHINPMTPELGIHYLPTIFNVVEGDAITAYIQEWRPYRFRQYDGFDVLLLVLLLATNFRERAVPVADKILTAAWVFAALYSLRHFPLLGIIAAPMLAICLEKALPHKSPNTLLMIPHRTAGWAVALLACTVLVISPARQLIARHDRVTGETTPEAGLAFLREHYAGLRFLNSWHYGGHMIYYNRATHQVAFDGRAGTVYPEATEMLYIDFLLNRPIDRQLAEWKVDGLFLSHIESAMALAALATDPRWKLVYRDTAVSVFVKPELAGAAEVHAVEP